MLQLTECLFDSYFDNSHTAWAKPKAQGAPPPTVFQSDHVQFRQWTTMHSAGCWGNVTHAGGGLCTSYQLLTGQQVIFWWSLDPKSFDSYKLQHLVKATKEYHWQDLNGWQFLVLKA